MSHTQKNKLIKIVRDLFLTHLSNAILSVLCKQLIIGYISGISFVLLKYHIQG